MAVFCRIPAFPNFSPKGEGPFPGTARPGKLGVRLEGSALNVGAVRGTALHPVGGVETRARGQNLDQLPGYTSGTP